MQSNKRIIAVVGICLIVVGISIAVRMNDNRENQASSQGSISSRSDSQDSLRADGEFFDENRTPAPSKTTPAIPGLTAKAYLVGDTKTGEIYIERNSTKPLPVASMSKLVTAFVSTDLMSSSTMITIASSTLSAPPDSSNLLKDEDYELGELLKPLLLSSSNVAAEAISLSGGNRDRFMELMSSYAWEIGMPSSFFADPSGVSPLNAASGRDLFELAKYLVNYRPDILAITRIPELFLATTTDHGGHQVVSTHPFVRDPRFVGGKTGRTTQAGETMMTILNMNGREIVFVILRSDFGSRENDTRILIRELEKKFNP